MSKMALGEALAQSQIDPVTGKFIHPDTKEKMTIAAAIEKGLLDPYSMFFVDAETGNVTSLGAFIEEGKFNPVTGKFKDPATGLEVSINSAIKKGIIEPHIDPDRYIEAKCPLKVLLDGGKVSPSNATFVTPDGEEMSLKDALAEGFITPDTIIKMDPKTGHIMGSEDGSDIIRVSNFVCIYRIFLSSNLGFVLIFVVVILRLWLIRRGDWIQLELWKHNSPSKARPSEDLNTIDEQIDNHRVGSFIHVSYT